MSAKSTRKSERLDLEPDLYAALCAFAAAHRRRSLAAAARLAVRQHLDDPRLRFALAARPAARRPRRLRLQLEAPLRARLAALDLSPAEALRRRLAPPA